MRNFTNFFIKSLLSGLIGWSGVLFSATSQPLPVEEIANGIFLFSGQQAVADKENHGVIANVGFIVGNHCVAVIDSGGSPEQGKQLMAGIHSVTTKPVCYVINTHVHPDHILGNLAFKQKGIRFVGHRNLPRAMALRGAHYLKTASHSLGIELPVEAIVLPDTLVGETLEIDLGGRLLILTAYPAAHTDNDLTVFDENTGALWLSDLLFVKHIPVLDGSINGWLVVIDQLQKKQVNLVVPGHGAVAQELSQALEPEKHYLQIVRRETKEVIAQGGSMEMALEKVGASEKNSWLLFDHFHKRTVSAAFAELEWAE
jgi:quinoprotein relay system zinc metallohydrolase 2